MTVELWAFVGLVTVAFSYTMKFTQATLSYGRILGNTDTGTGVQDAITPPWETNFGLVAYAGVAAAVGIMWWQEGWGSGLGALAVVLVGGGVVGAMLPDKDAPHFRNLIQRSMISRYANFVRDNDMVRAEAMKELLTRAGIDPDQLKSEPASK